MIYSLYSSDSQPEPPSPDEVATAIKNLNEFSQTYPIDKQPSYLKPLQEFVEDALKTVDLANDKSTSLKLWIILADQLLNDDFSALYPQSKERIQTRNISLDLLPSYRGLLVGKKGWRVQSIAKLAKCSIKFNFPKDGTFRTSIPVTLGGALKQILKAEERLKSAVKKIKAARELHEQRVSADQESNNM